MPGVTFWFVLPPNPERPRPVTTTPLPKTPYLRLAAKADELGYQIHHTFRNRTCTIILKDLKGVAQAGVSVPFFSFEESCLELLSALRGEL